MKKWAFILAALLVIGGGVMWLRARLYFKTPSPQQLREAFPGDAQQVFEESERFTLLSLDSSGIGGYTGKDAFHGYRIVGRTSVGPQDKARLIAALYNGMAENDGMIATCFSPRHGIRAVQGNKYVDLVICFHCLQIATYFNTGHSGTLTSASPQGTFDGVLQEAGVPLSPH